MRRGDSLGRRAVGGGRGGGKGASDDDFIGCS